MSVRANVDARRLDQQIWFERKTTTQDPATGDIAVTWNRIGPDRCWCAVDAVKATDRWREPEIAGGQRTISDFTVWVRADVIEQFQITDADRAYWLGGRQYLDIKDVLHQQRRGRLTPMVVQAGLNDG